MGYNSVVLLLNDQLNQLAQDPAKTVLGIIDAVRNFGYRHTRGDTQFAGQHEVVSSEHADHTVLIAVGGNYATIIHREAFCHAHHEEAHIVKLLRSAADKYGYRLVKKRNRNELTQKMSDR